MSRGLRRTLGLVLLAMPAAGCWGNEATPFPPGLEPLEECVAPPPDGTADDPYPEKLGLARGERGDYVWSHVRGYVHASLKDTWTAMRVRIVSVDRRKVARWSVSENVEPGYDDSYRIHNEVDNIITVSFEITWRHGHVEGTVEDPTKVAVRFQKTDGTVFIPRLEGSMVATDLGGGLTELEIVEHLEASGGAGNGEIESYLSDYFQSLLAQVHGRPLPTY